MLLDMGQSHLFENWAVQGVDDEEKKSFFEQVTRLDASYPGGLALYVKTARELLADSNVGKNSFDGFTPVLDALFAYAPVKNNPEDAAKVPKGNPYHSATSGEMAIYQANSLLLWKARMHIEDPIRQVFNGQEVEVWPRVVWKPKWAQTFADIKRKVGGNCFISHRSTLVIKGSDVFFDDL